MLNTYLNFISDCPDGVFVRASMANKSYASQVFITDVFGAQYMNEVRKSLIYRSLPLMSRWLLLMNLHSSFLCKGAETGRTDKDALAKQLLGVGLLFDFDDHYFMIAAYWKLGNITYYISFGVQDSREYAKRVVSVMIIVIENFLSPKFL